MNLDHLKYDHKQPINFRINNTYIPTYMHKEFICKILKHN